MFGCGSDNLFPESQSNEMTRRWRWIMIMSTRNSSKSSSIPTKVSLASLYFLQSSFWYSTSLEWIGPHLIKRKHNSKSSGRVQGLMSWDLQTFPAVCIPRAAWLSHIFPSVCNKYIEFNECTLKWFLTCILKTSVLFNFPGHLKGAVFVSLNVSVPSLSVLVWDSRNSETCWLKLKPRKSNICLVLLTGSNDKSS